MMRSLFFLLIAVALDADRRHHHKRHHHHHKNTTAVTNQTAPVTPPMNNETESTEKVLVEKMRALREKLGSDDAVKQGRIIVNGPLPTDFPAVFATAVAEATGCDASVVKVLSDSAVQLPPSFIQMTAELVEVTFEAPGGIVDQVLNQAADPDSKLVNGALNTFLVAKESEEEDGEDASTEPEEKPAPVDFDASQMPYGELEPFGREDTAQELTEKSIKESDEMVDQLERAEVAEEKRSVFRAITRLRGAAITSFDGIARSQTGNIDEYNHNHQWRKTHPLHHLAQEESDVSKWAFPSNAD